MDDKKDKIVFKKAEFIEEFDKQKENNIGVWDDAGLCIHRQDTIEKIREDVMTLCEDHNKAINAPDLMWTSSYSSLRILQIDSMFLIALMQLGSRIKALSRN